MSDPIISTILTQLTTILEQQIRREIQLVSGVEKQVQKLNSTFKSIRAVLIDAERRQVKEEAVKLWLEKLKDVSYDAEDVLSEWITSIRKAEIEGLEIQSSPAYAKVRSYLTLPCRGCNKYTLRRDIALKIESINERLDDVSREKDRFKFDSVIRSNDGTDKHKSSSFVDVSEVKGREADKDRIITKLLLVSEGNNQEKGLNIASISGQGGIGKTTLAQLVYQSLITHFERTMWVCVSDQFDEARVVKAIIEDIEGSAPHAFELETLLRTLRDYVRDTKFLLVLDDVWTTDCRRFEQLFNSLKTGGEGSSILITTRNERVAKSMGSTYNLCLGQLSAQDSWSLFSKIAFFDRKEGDSALLEEVGKKIAEKCKGLPLYIKTIASLMRFKKTLRGWNDVLGSEFWELEEADEIFPPLMLSYYDLPSSLKRCFSFCALFPKGHAIEASNLLQLWMAQGYLSSSAEDGSEMELVGQEYLQNLALRSFLQDLVRTKDHQQILRFKMHDMVHDFARYMMKNECSIFEADADFEQKLSSAHKSIRHLTLIRGEGSSFPAFSQGGEKLFTLWIQSFYDPPPILSQLDRVEPEFFLRLSSVKSLDLSRNRIGELTKEIEKLVKLKYLNLSHNPFWDLPETICELLNLQTLKLSSCVYLRKLPLEIGKLINLRHLEIDGADSLKILPKGIAKMRSLRTLSKFPIVRGKDATSNIEDLEILDNLGGYLKIEGIGSVSDGDEAKRANLHRKREISGLQLEFSPSIRSNDSRQDEVIEALCPNETVQSLHISSYMGSKLPGWIMGLTNLQKLYLKNCPNCESLPPLGRLPSLETLELDGLTSLERLGHHGDMTNVEFPKLKKLKISNMGNWREWNVITNGGGTIILDHGLKIMPRLACLKISNCGKLNELPYVLIANAPIRKLRVSNCHLLQLKYNKEDGEHWSKISHISNVRIS